jgi:potassium-transporting ATPase KdpC subunit
MRLWIACKMTIVLTLMTGILYPVFIAGISHLLFPSQAEGSLIVRGGRVVGSAVLGQNFSSARYFRGRPSAAGDKGYDAANSSGSNLGPTNKTLIDTVRARTSTLREHEPGINHHEIPVDLVTASGSGLDPEISPAAAEIQAPRVARARGISNDTLRAIIRAQTRPRLLGIFGEPGVNVLQLNLALDELVTGEPAKPSAR